MKTSGVYFLTQVSTGARYVGSSQDVQRRLAQHRRELLSGKNGNAALQEAFNKTGEGDFSFDVIEVIADKAARLRREQFYLDMIENKFNVIPVADTRAGGYTYSRTDEAFARTNAKLLDDEIVHDWAVIEISEEWRAMGKQFRDKFDVYADIKLRAEFESDIKDRETKIRAERLTKA